MVEFTCIAENPYVLSIKGTVSRDFQPSVYFHQNIPPVVSLALHTQNLSSYIENVFANSNRVSEI
jgi:hypothetical protein